MRKVTFNGRDALKMLQCVVLPLWPMTVYASSESLGSTFGAITMGDWLVMVALSVFSGFVALLQRVKKSYEYDLLVKAGQSPPITDKQLVDWRLYTTYHMLGALFAGFIAFIICEEADLSTYIEALTISAFGWSGAKAVDMIADGVTGTILNKVGAIFGKGGTA